MASLKFNNVYIKDYYAIVGPKEKESNLKKFQQSIDDYYFGEKTFEKAEIKMQRVVIDNLLKNNNLVINDIDYLLAGDLINQIAISSYTSRNYTVPFIGMYAACATFPEEVLIGGNLIESKNAKQVICLTSSHSLTAERQYRYPVEYGNTKPSTATCTATASMGIILTSKVSRLKVKGGTFGKTIDLGINDTNHMGAVMAPSCADTIFNHLKNNNMKPTDYDVILTGDLGKVGIEILKKYYEKTYHEKLPNVIDSGSLLYKENQNMMSGGSGPCCLPLMLFCNVLNVKKYKRLLVIGTGSLHTPVLVNQKNSIPSVSHAIDIEAIS